VQGLAGVPAKFGFRTALASAVAAAPQVARRADLTLTGRTAHPEATGRDEDETSSYAHAAVLTASLEFSTVTAIPSTPIFTAFLPSTVGKAIIQRFTVIGIGYSIIVIIIINAIRDAVGISILESLVDQAVAVVVLAVADFLLGVLARAWTPSRPVGEARLRPRFTLTDSSPTLL